MTRCLDLEHTRGPRGGGGEREELSEPRKSRVKLKSQQKGLIRLIHVAFAQENKCLSLSLLLPLPSQPPRRLASFYLIPLYRFHDVCTSWTRRKNPFCLFIHACSPHRTAANVFSIAISIVYLGPCTRDIHTNASN